MIEEFVTLCETEGVACWLRGGWALDFLLGKIPHAGTATSISSSGRPTCRVCSPS